MVTCVSPSPRRSRHQLSSPIRIGGASVSDPRPRLTSVFYSIRLRDEPVPDLLVVVRLGSNTLHDQHLVKRTA